MHPHFTFDLIWHGLLGWLALIGIVVLVPCIAYVLVKLVAGRLRDNRTL